MIFNVPAVDNFCRVIQNGITECGGPEKFFDNLTRDSRNTLRKAVPDTQTQDTLFKILSDENYRELFIVQIATEDDRELINGFLQGWKIWSESYPFEAEELILFLIPSYDLLESPLPRESNEVYACASVLDLDAFREAFMVRTVLKLAYANKNIGGPHALMMTGRLSTFLITIKLMLRSVLLRGTESGLFKMPEDRTRPIASLLTQLGQIEEVVANLRRQFENMR